MKVLVEHDDHGVIHSVFAVADDSTSATVPLMPAASGGLQLTQVNAPQVKDLTDQQGLQTLRERFRVQTGAGGGALVPKAP
jgi:hypothetical protein